MKRYIDEFSWILRPHYRLNSCKMSTNRLKSSLYIPYWSQAVNIIVENGIPKWMRACYLENSVLHEIPEKYSLVFKRLVGAWENLLTTLKYESYRFYRGKCLFYKCSTDNHNHGVIYSQKSIVNSAN